MTPDSTAASTWDVAIIGLAGRFPGAADIEQFWSVLTQGRDCATFFSEQQLQAAGVDSGQLQRPGYVKANQLLQDVEMFDADVFGFPRREAEILDPQQRLMLECALVALEHAGYDPRTELGSVGVYVGAGMNTYLLHNLHQRYRAASSVEHYQLLLASDKDFLPTRISYKLNLKGPSLCINTACSTSLVAVHMACVSLLSGECDMALAGGVSIRVPQLTGYQFQEGMIFSPDGHCRAFDHEASGTILGDGLGLVVLKRLPDALRDRDTIHAIIKGSAVNNDGSAKAGYTAPSVDGQATVVSDALAIAGVEAETIGYIEAHGTATPLGDPIEVSALTMAHRKHSDANHYCALGSVKTNIGHLDTAAGIAGLIKTILMLERRTLVPSLHFTQPNPQIDFEHSPFYVQTRTEPWLAEGDRPLRAGVSAFGIGGTNAHVILEEPPSFVPEVAPARAELIILSANSPAQLDQATADLARHLRKHRQLCLADVALTQALGRTARACRRIVVGDSVHEVALALALGEQEKVATQEVSGSRPRVILGLPDMSGEDRVSVADLRAGEPVFRRHYDECLAHGSTQNSSALECFARSFAFAQLFLSAGIQPAAVLGFGVGAFAAAAVSGVLALEDALQIVRQHGASVDGRVLASTNFNRPALPVWSAVTGGPASAEEVTDSRFWLHHTVIRRCPAIQDGSTLLDLGLAPAADGSALRVYLRKLGALWLQGCDVDWSGCFSGRAPRRIPLPTYPFRRERYWVEASNGGAAHGTADSRSALVLEIASAAPPARERVLALHLQRQIASIIGMRDAELPDIHASFMELGLESLTLIEIVTRLGGELGIAIRASSLVEYPTIAAFARQVIAMLAPAPPTADDTANTPAAADARRAAMLEQRNRRRNGRASRVGA